jgi:hypothetical protein
MMMSTNPNILLHWIGEDINEKRIVELFDNGTTYVIWNPDIIAVVKFTPS